MGKLYGSSDFGGTADKTFDWPVFSINQSYRQTDCGRDSNRVVDLSKPSTLLALGIAQKLGAASYIRPEPDLRNRLRRKQRQAENRTLMVLASAAHSSVVETTASVKGATNIPMELRRQYWMHLYLWQKEPSE